MVIRKPGNIAESFCRLHQLLMPLKWHLVYLEDWSKPVWSDAFFAAFSHIKSITDVPECFSIEMLHILWKLCLSTVSKLALCSSSVFVLDSLFPLHILPSKVSSRLWILALFLELTDLLWNSTCHGLLAGLRPFSTSMLCFFSITAQKE